MMSARAFSAASRAARWEALGARTFDVLVIGGGITGAGIALDAATRGLSVALVEAGDFACGTSSRSSRLIHGGLRYLETLDFALVFEASAERRRLLELAPHLVRPLPFLFPIWKGGPVGYRKLQAGLFLYDALALLRNIEPHRMLGRDEALEAEPRLGREGLRGGGVYYDAEVDDARLTLAVARAAHEAGALLVTRACASALLRDEHGALRGAAVRDELGGQVSEVRARVVVNATGPWCDEVRRLADPEAQPRLRPTKGVHAMLRAGRVGNRGALIFPSPIDGRVMFVLPWARDFTFIGTTDTDFGGAPQSAAADAADVEYLLASVNAIFPGTLLERDDVVSSWAGVRPLLAPERGVSESQTSREHEIWREAGLLNIAGGKLTTYRVMAEQTVDAAAKILRDEHGVASGESKTAELRLPGAPEVEWEEFVEGLTAECAALGLARDAALHLAHSYGTDAREVLDRVRAEPVLGRRIVPGLPPVRAEIAHAVEREMALTLEDVLRRRLHLLDQAEDGAQDAARATAEQMATLPGLGWDAHETEAQIDAYAHTVRKTRAFRTPA
jgi:glycerol-3-phosphate dehydrogenase